MNSTHDMMVNDDLESGSMGLYQDRPRTFPNMRNKAYTPLVFRICLGINVRVFFILLLLGFGAIFYIGASTSPIIVFVFSVCILSFLVSIYLTKWVLAKDDGPPEMVRSGRPFQRHSWAFTSCPYKDACNNYARNGSSLPVSY